ncbi:hypothetical protein HHK36_025944 [Tetracentron sinense]|uniref:Enhancer of rudimentary homolog n=1 Tax=Tetracentron sinense TaxID=13715 RepID=A0A835D410_TETSI|nr:hypothetical protein HHK36_025944 [Tetracentron sinense]
MGDRRLSPPRSETCKRMRDVEGKMGDHCAVENGSKKGEEEDGLSSYLSPAAARFLREHYGVYLVWAGICGLYERKLRDLNPAIGNITYDIADLYNFIDGLTDLSALVYDHSIQAYLPYDRQWIKQRTFQHLRKLSMH